MYRALMSSLLPLLLNTASAMAQEAQSAIERVLESSQTSKKGVVLFVQGGTLAGGVIKLVPGQWVELKSQEYSSIVVRLDRIDAVATR